MAISAMVFKMGIKVYLGLALLLLVLVFIIQNAAVVDIRFLFWKVSMSRSLMVFFVLCIGIIIGWIGAGYLHRKHDKPGIRNVT